MPRPAETPKSTLRVALRPAGGIKSDRDSSLIGDGQAAFAENCEFSTETARISKGSRKLGNQTLPQPAVLCRPDPAYSPLYVEASKSVPLRGYVAWPYDSVRDIGGDDASTGAFPALEYHARRGRSFERQYTVTIPPDFQMHERPARGEGGPAVENAAVAAGPGYDEGLDDCTLIAQKGGDRTTPMSWGLGIVNAGNHAYNIGAGSSLARKSGYFFTFMWYDAPEWGAIDQTKMRYDLSDPSASATGRYSTQALRAFILDGKDDTVAYALEPGKTYSISISVTMDSAGMTDGAWNGDGRVDFRVQEHGGRLYQGSFASGTATNLSAWKGPLDSLDYLSKYGIRYAGMDMEHIGLGYRLGPWQAQGWIPYGHDSAAMEHKGFRMADCSLNSIDDLYGAGQYTLVCSHAGAADAYVTINTNRALVTANANFKQTPLGVIGASWSGYGAGNSGAPASDFNADALRGYRWVVPRDSVTDLQGGCLNIEDYVEAGVGDYRIGLKDAGSLGVTWTDKPFLIRAFRWNQQALVIQEVRAWSAVRDYTDPRVVFSMRSSLELSDQTEPNLERLEAYLPMNDAGGAVCRELVRAKDAYLAPFGLGVKDYGDEEERRSIFLSGEGDALVYDLSKNPVFAREMKALLQSNSRGFAIEVSCIIPEAYYGVAILNSTDRAGEYEAAYCPDLVAWSVKGSDEAGTPASPAPLLVMGHHSWWPQGTGTTPERKPQGFQVDYHAGLDGDKAAMSTAIVGFTRSGSSAGLWDDTAPWVGRRIILQVGIQPSPANRSGSSPSEFRVYIAATPKGSLKFAAGEDPSAEFAYYSDKAIQKKELERLIVTIGGGWNPSAVRGYTEYSARMVVEDVRIYGAVASGELPGLSGDVTPARRGKILGRNSLPQRDLTPEDIVRPVGAGTRTAKLTEGSTVVETAGAPSFFTQLPEDSLDSAQERFLVPLADLFPLPSLDQIVDFTQEFYWIKSLSADGSSMTLASPYEGPESLQASVGVVNLIGYTAFQPTVGDVLRAPLSLGSGQAFKPGVTTTESLALSPELFRNIGPVQGEWRVRIASPFTEGGLVTVLPRWVRGCVSPRRGPVTALQSLDSSLFAAGRGALFRMDDRWREDGPTDTLRSSIQILGRTVGEHEARFPLANDGIRFSRYENVWPYWTSLLSRNYTWTYDFDIYIEEYAGLQTLAWLGCEFSHLLLGPAANDNRRGVGLWFRLAEGRPEILMESQGLFTGGSTAPTDGEYIATSADRIPLKRWTRVRFYLESYLDNGLRDSVRIPGILIEGHPTSVSVNAVEGLLVDPLAWVQTGNGGGLIGSIGDSRNALLVGVARDSVRTQNKSQFTALGQLGGQEYQGTRISGHMHPLLGRIGRMVVWRALTSDPSVAGYPAYNPETLDYAGRLVRFRAEMEEGVGELLADTGTETEVGFDPQPGLILSHPALDLYSEFGARLASPSLVPSGNRVYAANGGRVVSLLEDSGGPAGVLAPSSRPEVVVSRKPLWEPNFAPEASNDTEQDPIEEAAAGAAEQIHHYSSYGNNYLRQNWNDALRWSKDDDATNTPFGIFGLKFYWHPRSTSGVIPLWGARGSRDSGGIYLECVDGRAAVGWYDTEMKKRVFVETTARIFRPGYWYYVYLRKAFPMQDEKEGNWLNSWGTGGMRRRANFTEGVAGWAPGDIIKNAGGAKRGIVTKITSTHIEYLRFVGDADFSAGEAVVQDGGVATGAVDQAPYHMTGDSLVVREMHKTGTFIDTVLWKQTASGSNRNAVSFTSEMPRSIDTSAVGQVTPKGILFTGSAGGFVSVGTMLAIPLAVPAFHPDLVGMQWQFSATTPGGEPEKVYRISQVFGDFQIQVVDEDGNSPNLSDFINKEGGAFSGVELKKSEGYDESHLPDRASYGIEFMGSGLAHFSSNGIAKHSGKFASFGWGVVSSDISNSAFYSGFNLFEAATPTELSDIGTDALPFTIFSSSGRPGELHFDSGAVFSAVDGQPYAGAAAESSQPSSALEVTQDTEADEEAESLFWRYIQEPRGWEGRRQVFVTFYDRGQAQESNPSEALVIEVPAEDESNASGLSRLDLTNVPISHQAGPIERWIYVTRADEIVPFRMAVIPDNRASSISLVLDDERFSTARLLSRRNGAPPDCFALATSQDRMWFGDLRIPAGRQKDAVAFSAPFFPTRVPSDTLLPLITGRSERVVGMADVDGVLMVWKRDAMIQVLLREGRPIAKVKSENVGLAGPQAMVVLDRDAYWLSEDRGMYLFPGAGGPIWLGENLSDMFGGLSSALNVDGRHLAMAAVAVNRNQDQVVALFRAKEDLDQRRRLSIEFDGALAGAGVPGNAANGFRYALYAGPNLTAIGAVNRRVAGPQRFVGGTAEGFVTYLDRPDTQRELAAATGTQTVTLGAGSTTSKLVLGAADASLVGQEGVRGLPLAWLDGGSEPVHATALFSDGLSIWLDRPVVVAPGSGTTVSLGAIHFEWRSKRLDLGAPEDRKIPHFAHVVMVPQVSGTAWLEVYEDYGASPVELVVDGDTGARYALDLTQPVVDIPLGEIRSQFVQLRIRVLPPSVGVAIEVKEVVLHWHVAELH